MDQNIIFLKKNPPEIDSCDKIIKLSILVSQNSTGKVDPKNNTTQA